MTTERPRGTHRTAALAGFVVYALILVTLTHWPNLEIHGPIERPDLVIHLGAFGLWALLFSACGWFGPATSWRNVRWTWPIGLAYAALDEITQGLPGVHRHVALDDWCANATGITLACIAMLTLGRWLRRTTPPLPREADRL